MFLLQPPSVPTSCRVYDNVLSPSTCTYLHAASSLGELGNEFHTAFSPTEPQTAIERCLTSVLAQLNDDSPCVEYWWRDEWTHVEAHEDVDEYLFADTGERRYPKNGHVLYLEVGESIRAPTCVWEPSDDATPRHEFGALTTVPALSGRLLRFPGACMHAVPKPASRWLPVEHRGGPSPAAQKKRPGSSSGGKKDTIRSVILFNTWSEPPLDVGAAEAKDPQKVIEALAAEFNSPKIEALVNVMANPEVLCRPYDDWVTVPPQQPAPRRRDLQLAETGTWIEQVHDEEDVTPPPMTVALLGEEERRGQPETTLELEAPDGLLEALLEQSAVTSFA